MIDIVVIFDLFQMLRLLPVILICSLFLNNFLRSCLGCVLWIIIK